MYKAPPPLTNELARALASCVEATRQSSGTHTERRRVVDETTRRAVLAWAREKDRVLSARLDKRCARALAQHHSSSDPRRLRELGEARFLRASRAFTVMAELLLDTDCTLRELWAMRWTDIQLTPRGLQIWLGGRRCVVTVDESSFDDVPHLSAWVFEGMAWESTERAWRGICKKLHLPDDIFA